MRDSGDILDINKVISYANQSGNIAGSNISATLKQMSFSQSQIQKQQEQLKQAQQEAQKRQEAGKYFQKLIYESIPKTSQIGIEPSKLGGYSDIQRQQSIDISEAYKRGLERPVTINHKYKNSKSN